jgi:nitroreductase
MSLVMKRNSIREFKTDEISSKMIESLLKAGMQAPSANNQQPWNFIVVTERPLLDKLSKMSRGSWPLGTAPLAIIPVMLPTEKSPQMRVQDMAASTQNILLQAVYEKLGGVWIGVNPIEDRVKYIKDLFEMGKDEIPFCIIALGFPSKKKELITRYDETRVHYNEWKK